MKKKHLNLSIKTLFRDQTNILSFAVFQDSKTVELNSEDSDQTAQMYKLIVVVAVYTYNKAVFPWTGLIDFRC